MDADKRAKRELCKEWAREKRNPLRAFPRRNVLGRVREEAEGASIRSWLSDYVPRVEFTSPTYRMIEKAWRTMMTEEEALVFALHFLAKGSPRDKWEAVGVSKRTYYRRLDSALIHVPPALPT